MREHTSVLLIVLGIMALAPTALGVLALQMGGDAFLPALFYWLSPLAGLILIVWGIARLVWKTPDA
jgi:hypothetical protein